LTTYQCPGPGEAGTLGSGLWVQSRFSLESYAGNRVRVRWIAQSWEFDSVSSSYEELGGWDNIHDDGWWVDRIKFNGALDSPAAATVDAAAPPETGCPVGNCIDLDGDGFGRAGASECAGGRLEDCDDGDAAIFPGATETCDNDCDGAVDEDSDGDGVAVCDDCNDADPATYPGAPERCDFRDNDCDGIVDDLADVADFDNDGVAGACDNCPGHANPGQEDQDFDGHGDVCDNCPTIPNDTQNPAACDQRVVDIILDSGGPGGRGSGVLSWRTTAEVDVTGFNAVVINSRGERVQLNDIPIACEACITGDSVTYSFGLPKHKSAHSLFVELIRQGGVVETYGPARRASGN
jgi:hypothetical protein